MRRIGALGLLLVGLLLPAGRAVALPPGYGFEKVTPDAVGKNDADVPLGQGVVRVSAEGTRATWLEAAASPTDEGAPVASQGLSVFTGSGWAARGIAPPLGADEGGASVFSNSIGYQTFSSNLDKGILAQGGPPLVPGAADEQGMRNLYLRSLTGDFGYQLLTPPPLGSLTLKDTIIGLGTVFYSPKVADATPDLSTVAFESSFLPLAPGAAEGSGGYRGLGKPSVYLWRNGQVELASVLENGESPPEGAIAGAGVGAGVNGSNSYEGYMPGILSEDGSRVFFTVPTGPEMGGAQSGPIYVRIDGTRTQYVSKSHLASPEPAQPALFVTSSTDGRYAFFASDEKLTEDSNATPETPSKTDLYRYDVDTEELVDLTASLSHGNSYEGTIGISDDGSTVYLVDGTRGYVWRDGLLKRLTTYAGKTTELIARQNSVGPTLQANTNSAVSADGKWALTQSEAEIDGWQTGNKPQLFLYDRETESTTCISCLKGGVPSAGAYTNNEITYGVFAVKRQYRPRVISNDDSKVTFETATPLTAEDHNATVDVYQYDTGSGELQLLSSGVGSYPSYLGDVSANGNSVFFTTRQRLVPEDKDGLEDLYVARPGGSGGYQAAEVTRCSGEACQGPLATAPGLGPAGSALLVGPGNAKANRGKSCTKGKGKKAGGSKTNSQRCGGKPGKGKKRGKRKAGKGNSMHGKNVAGQGGKGR